MNLRGGALILVAAFGSPVAAHAQSALQVLRGEYAATRPQSMTLRTLVVGEAAKKLIAVEIIVGDRGCTGVFTGLGAADGYRILAKPYEPGPGTEKCAITLRVDPTGKSVAISQNDECSDFHGASCRFVGTVTAK